MKYHQLVSNLDMYACLGSLDCQIKKIHKNYLIEYLSLLFRSFHIKYLWHIRMGQLFYYAFIHYCPLCL